ncbi:MAG: hypothetical protein ACJA2S_000263 [Cyclobacteriaceae bacterium]|jgi:hypothetical protein
MKSIKYIIIGLLTFSFTACDDYVDVDPIAEINSESYFNSEEDYQQALIGAYDMLQSTFLNNILSEIASDNSLAGGENANDAVAWQEIDDMRHTVVNSALRDIWKWMYGGIYRVNYIFEFKDKTEFEGKDAVLGQAAFLRAYYYFELVKYFGDVPMPIDKRVQFGEETSFGRTPKSEVYAQMEADLIFAAENLPIAQSQLGRVTKGAAKALLGKAYLYQDKFNLAATVLQEVIDPSFGYDLTDFNTLFLPEGENGIESVFEIQYSDQEGAGYDCLSCSEGNVLAGFSGPYNFEGPTYTSGNRFNLPTQNLVDEFEEGDLRLETTILDIDDFVEANPGTVYTVGFEHTGYFNNKYLPRTGEQSIGDTKLTNNRNFRAIRFADVLLMAAEAMNRDSGTDDTQALIYLNRVRERAGLAPVTVTGQALTDAIYHDRRIELAGEGQRFFDLVRTGRAADNIPDFVAGKHELFPIPQEEIDLLGGSIAQNANY